MKIENISMNATQTEWIILYMTSFKNYFSVISRLYNGLQNVFDRINKRNIKVYKRIHKTALIDALQTSKDKYNKAIKLCVCAHSHIFYIQVIRRLLIEEWVEWLGKYILRKQFI